MTNPLSHTLLVTGPPGIGKSTTVRSIASSLDAQYIAGFLSRELRIDGRRQGFNIELINTGQVGVLASPGIKGSPRFGSLLPDGQRRLGVSLEFLEEVVCPAIDGARDKARLFVLDEIGPMQGTSSIFRDLVDSLIHEERMIIASIAESEDQWITNLREAPTSAVFALNRGNRDVITAALSCYLHAFFVQDDKEVDGWGR